MVQIYFATNRKPDATQPFGFGAELVQNRPEVITYAVADVQGIVLDQEGSGAIVGITDRTPGTWSDAATEAIVAAGRNLLVFIHGFDNAFEDAIKRAAFNAEWFRASGVAAADTTVLAFSWPSAGRLIAAPPHFPPEAYFADQTRAGKSGFHLGFFLNTIDQLRRDYVKRNPGGRIFLLAHSMGNFALQAGIEWWFANGGTADEIFDETFLAAADEEDDTFEKGAARLGELPKLTRRISIYNSRRDVAMFLSTTFNHDERLGFDGPDDKRNATKYPPAKFRIGDCTGVGDFKLVDPPDASHQYYRRSKIVRTDIAAVMADDAKPAGGLFDLPKG